MVLFHEIYNVGLDRRCLWAFHFYDGDLPPPSLHSEKVAKLVPPVWWRTRPLSARWLYESEALLVVISIRLALVTVVVQTMMLSKQVVIDPFPAARHGGLIHCADVCIFSMSCTEGNNVASAIVH